MYRLPQHPKHKHASRKRKVVWLGLAFWILLGVIAGSVLFAHSLRSKPVITQSAAVTTKVDYKGQLKHYDEGDFSVDLPVNWQLDPRPANTYQSFTWSISDHNTNGQQVEIFEDTIPTNDAVNRALIIHSDTDHVDLVGQASDNCINFTKNLMPMPNSNGVRAKWQDIDFLCDQAVTTSDSIGTSSADGINTVILQTSEKVTHKYFFLYTDQELSPDYSVFYDAIRSFKMN